MSTEIQPERKPQGATGDATVLLVDDEQFVLDVQRRIIHKSGLKCVAASGCVDAVAAIRMNPGIRLVILDAVLTDDSSMEVFKQIKAINPSVRVLVASGFSKDGPVQDLLDAGADDFLPKPFVANDLLQRMKAILAPTV